MSRLELSRGNKSLWQRVEALWRSMLPRQARVTRTDGHSVWVRFLGDSATDPESKFPSTVSGVPVATMGWVITLGGKKGLFIATGSVRGIQHAYAANASPSNDTTTAVTASYEDASVLRSYALSDLIPEITEGMWEVMVTAHAVVYRSVATGGVYLFVGDGSSHAITLGRLSPQDHAYTLTVSTVLLMGPNGTVDMRFSGFSTAGTTRTPTHGWKIIARRVS